MRSITRIAALALLSLAVVFLSMGANCIVSGNVLVIIEDLGPIHASSSGEFQKVSVDLKTNGTWNDHKKDLISIDDIGFACKITNHELTEATGQIWISDKSYSSPADVRANAVKILDGIAVPADSSRSIEWKESADFLSNFNEAKTIIYTEKFYLYFMVAETPFSIDVNDIVLFLSCNGKP